MNLLRRSKLQLLTSILTGAFLIIGCQLPRASDTNNRTTTSESRAEAVSSAGNSGETVLDSSDAISETALAASTITTATIETSTNQENTTEPTASEPAASDSPASEQPSVEQIVQDLSVPPIHGIPNLTTISEVDWSPDGQWLVVSGANSAGQSELVVHPFPDLSAPAWQATISQLDGPQSVVISRNSQQIAAITGVNTVTVWDSATGATIANLSYGEFAPINSVTFSPSGDRLAIGGAVGPAGLVKVVDLATQGELFNIPYDQPFMQLSFQPNGQFLSGAVSHSCGPEAAYAFTINLDGDITNFDWRRDVQIQHPQLDTSGNSKMLTVGAYGQRCQFYSSDIQMVDPKTESITGNVVRLAAVPTAQLSADGTAFVVDDGNRMEVWRDNPLRRVRSLDPAVGKPLAISPDGTFIAQANGNVITFVSSGDPDEPALITESDAPFLIIEDFAALDPTTVEARYQRMDIPDGLLSITKASQSAPTFLNFVVEQAAIDKYLMAVHQFDTAQDWTGARYIEIDVRNGPEASPLMIQLRERHADGRQGDSWRGSRAVPPFSDMTVSILLKAGKGFNAIPTAPAGDGVLDLNAIGTIELGVTSHHVMRGQMEITSIRLYD